MRNGRPLDRIEAILAEIERLDGETGGQYRQAEDREALNIAKRIERKMQQNQGKKRVAGG